MGATLEWMCQPPLSTPADGLLTIVLYVHHGNLGSPGTRDDAWATTPVGEVMTRMPVKTLAPEANVSAALVLMVANGLHQAPIVRDGALPGMLSRSDVMRYMQLGAELNLQSSTPSNAAPAESRVASSRG